MEAIGTISIRRHDSDQGSAGLPDPAEQSLLCIRVKGGNPLKAGDTCRKLLQPNRPATAIALTVEHLKCIGPTHIAICMEIYRTGQESRRDVYICGADKSFQRNLKQRGLSADGDKAMTFPSLKALIAKLTTPPRHSPDDGPALIGAPKRKRR